MKRTIVITILLQSSCPVYMGIVVGMRTVLTFAIILIAQCSSESQLVSRPHLRNAVEPGRRTLFSQTYTPVAQNLSFHGHLLESSTFAQTYSYNILVGSVDDAIVDPDAWSNSILQSSCSLRSAWMLCMSLINAVTCPSSVSDAVLIQCGIVLPMRSSTAILDVNGGALDLTSQYRI